MTILSRLYNFVNGAPSDADAVDAELNQIIDAINTLVVAKDGSIAMTGALTLPGNATTNLQAVPKQQVDALIGAPSIPGFVGLWGGPTTPAGWLLCDGAAISRATYSDLFAAIGTTHGAGNGTTTFNVPDFRGCVPMGAGTGPGLTPRTAGARVGAETTTGNMLADGHYYMAGAGGAGLADLAHRHVQDVVQPSTALIICIKY